MTEHTTRHDDPCWGTATIARSWHSCSLPAMHDGLHRCECGTTWQPWWKPTTDSVKPLVEREPDGPITPATAA